MHKAVVVGKSQAALTSAPLPQRTSGQVLVKIQVAPMCAEYKYFLEGTPCDGLGHEAVGEVVETDESERSVRVGDRVVCMPLDGCGRCELCLSGDYIHCRQSRIHDTAMAQYALKPAFLLRPIPEDLSYDQAALACCGLGASFGAIQQLRLSAYDTILIAGLGPVGLGAVVNARYRGARVIGVESNPYRSNLAKELGAETVLDPGDPDIVDRIRQLCGGTGPDSALDCSGAVPAHRLCIDAVRRKGQVAFVGESRRETPVIVSDDLIRKGIRLIGSWHYNLNDYPKLIQVIRHSPLASKLITHRFPLSRIQDAFEESVRQQSGKILLYPWAQG